MFCEVIKNLPAMEGYWTTIDGGTYMGISRNFWPDSRIWFYVDKEQSKKKLKYNEQLKDKRATGIVEVFYYEHFWNEHNLALIDNLRVQNYMFYQCINFGGKTAIKHLQEVAGLTGKDVDGIMGEQTANAVNPFGVAILDLLANRQRKYYERIIAANPSKAKYKKEWFRRIDKLLLQDLENIESCAKCLAE